MAETVHLTFMFDTSEDDGSGGTLIEGDSTQMQEGRENTIECFWLDCNVTSPFDPGSGRMTGRREFRPLRIRKRIDRSSGKLAEALVRGVPCYCKFDFYHPEYEEGPVYWIELARATVSGYRQILPDTMGSPSADVREPYEEVDFTFDMISWWHAPSQSGYQDSWSGKHAK